MNDGFEAPGFDGLDVTAWYAPERWPGFELTGGVFDSLDKSMTTRSMFPKRACNPKSCIQNQVAR